MKSRAWPCFFYVPDGFIPAYIAIEISGVMGVMKFKRGFGSGGFFKRMRACLCANIWWIFAVATLFLFGYVFFFPNYWLMLVLLMLGTGLVLWRC